jgi:hypothetical protein
MNMLAGEQREMRAFGDKFIRGKLISIVNRVQENKTYKNTCSTLCVVLYRCESWSLTLRDQV